MRKVPGSSYLRTKDTYFILCEYVNICNSVLAVTPGWAGRAAPPSLKGNGIGNVQEKCPKSKCRKKTPLLSARRDIFGQDYL
ncbi:hypothetical protein XENTR_v10007845 [Xenopus tropicalis]|nr:hypothetical protein XENTR_v10007845 [Xenopus tropicalis]